MSETVATTDGDESPEGTEPEVTPSGEDVATIKRRLAGKDQALTRAAKERDEYRSEAARLQAKVAEFEQSNLTEVERLTQRVADAEARATKAQEEARKQALARKSPLYADFLDAVADLDLNSEDAAKAFEDFIETRVRATGSAGDETEREPRIDPNKARKQGGGVIERKRMTTDELRAEIAKVSPDVLFGR